MNIYMDESRLKFVRFQQVSEKKNTQNETDCEWQL